MPRVEGSTSISLRCRYPRNDMRMLLFLVGVDLTTAEQEVEFVEVSAELARFRWVEPRSRRVPSGRDDLRTGCLDCVCVGHVIDWGL